MIKNLSVRNNSTGYLIEIYALTSETAISSLDNSIRIFKILMNYLLTNGEKINLHIDNTFINPKDNEVYYI